MSTKAMTLSLHPSAAWDRTLPRLPSLLPRGNIEYHRRGSPREQHHPNDSRSSNTNGHYAEGTGRRSTVACIPTTHEYCITNASTSSTNLDSHEHLLRKRPASVMSIEDTSPSSSPSSTSPLEGVSSLCVCQKDRHVPRPRNAFILYRQHYHASVVAQNPGLPNPDISKIIGEQWRQLPDKAKEEWKALAEDEKARHAQQYPNYRYKPRRNGRLGQQSSVSGPLSASSDTPTPCHKCGGNILNAPHTPFTPVFTAPTTSGISNMPQMQNARISTAQIVSPPHSARMRQYPDAYGRPIPPQHDPRFQYAPMQIQQRPSQQIQVMEGPELKKRRFNGDAVYATARPMYSDQAYQQSPRERTISDGNPGQFYRPMMGPPSRTGHPVQMSHPGRVLHAQSQHRRDASLTLPPLKTPLGQQVPASFSGGAQSQKSGVEAMIMSIPVLNKVRVLSQIAPALATPGPASPPQEIRGAVIAVEGMDQASVQNMTNSLAEQLGRDGKFAVRVFEGPNPYTTLASSNKASNGEGDQLNPPDILNVISQWHKISKDMQEYITKKPQAEREADNDVEMGDTDQPEDHSHFQITSDQSESGRRPRTPISAVSPKTITQTADLSLESPAMKETATDTNQKAKSVSSPTPQTKPRIPASAIAQAQAEAEAANKARTQSQSQSKPQPEPNTSTNTTTSQPQPQPQSQDPTPRRPTTTQSPSGPTIPIALVPHYQLTTVNTCSIAMPINDAYSPHSHWQWLATLWRGCIGPDVTVIIQASDPEDSESSANASRPPATAVAARQDVEVRLLDCKAVIVRAAGGSGNGGVGSSGKGRTDSEVAEWWEKARRRVGFEVEEFLRR